MQRRVAASFIQAGWTMQPGWFFIFLSGQRLLIMGFNAGGLYHGVRARSGGFCPGQSYLIYNLHMFDIFTMSE